MVDNLHSKVAVLRDVGERVTNHHVPGINQNENLLQAIPNPSALLADNGDRKGSPSTCLPSIGCDSDGDWIKKEMCIVSDTYIYTKGNYEDENDTLENQTHHIAMRQGEGSSSPQSAAEAETATVIAISAEKIADEALSRDGVRRTITNERLERLRNKRNKSETFLRTTMSQGERSSSSDRINDYVDSSFASSLGFSTSSHVTMNESSSMVLFGVDGENNTTVNSMDPMVVPHLIQLLNDERMKRKEAEIELRNIRNNKSQLLEQQEQTQLPVIIPKITLEQHLSSQTITAQNASIGDEQIFTNTDIEHYFTTEALLEQEQNLPVWVQQKLISLENSVKVKDSALNDAILEVRLKDVELEQLKAKTGEVLKVGTTIKQLKAELLSSQEQVAIFENELGLKSSLLETAQQKHNELIKIHTDMEETVRICIEQCGVQSIEEIPKIVETMQIEIHQQKQLNDCIPEGHNRMIQECIAACQVRSLSDIPIQIDRLARELQELNSMLKKEQMERSIDQQAIQDCVAQCQVHLLRDIPLQFNQLRSDVNERDISLRKAEQELESMRAEALGLLKQAKVYAIETDAETELMLQQNDELIQELQELLCRSIAEHRELDRILNEVKVLCNCTKLQEIPTMLEELQVQLNNAIDEKDRAMYTMEQIAVHCEVNDVEDVPEKYHELKKLLQKNSSTTMENISTETETIDALKNQQQQVSSTLLADSNSDSADKKLRMLQVQCNVRSVDEIPDNIKRLESEIVSKCKQLSGMKEELSRFKLAQAGANEPSGSEANIGTNVKDASSERIDFLEAKLAEYESKVVNLEESLAAVKITADRVHDLGASVDTLQKAIVRANEDHYVFEKNISLIHNICKMNRIQVIPEALMELKRKISEARGRLISSDEAKESLTAGEELKQYANKKLGERLEDLQRELSKTKEELKRAEVQSYKIQKEEVSSQESVLVNKLNNCTTSKEVIETWKGEVARSETKARLLQNEVNKLRGNLESAQCQIEELRNNSLHPESSSGIEESSQSMNVPFGYHDGHKNNRQGSEKSSNATAEMQKLQLLLERKEREIEELNTEIQDQSSQLTNARSTIENLQDERGYNQAKLFEIETIMNSTLKSDTENQLKEKSMECARLTVECSHLKQKQSRLEGTMETLQRDVDQKRDMIRQLVGSKSYHDFVQKLQKENEAGLAKAADLSLQLAESRGRVETLESEVRRLKFEVHGKEEKEMKSLSGATRQGIQEAGSMIRKALVRTTSGDWGDLASGESIIRKALVRTTSGDWSDLRLGSRGMSSAEKDLGLNNSTDNLRAFNKSDQPMISPTREEQQQHLKRRGRKNSMRSSMRLSNTSQAGSAPEEISWSRLG